MRFATPLVRGRLVRRYKRFLADVQLDTGETVTAHCANPGSLMGLNRPGATVYCATNDNPRRALRYSWELVEIDGRTIGINTALPNRLVEAAILDGTITELGGYARLRREIPYGRNSRIDLQLEDHMRPTALVEVKNVHLMREPDLAEFPDSVTARGAKHLDEMARAVAAGYRAVMVYLIQYPGCDRFRLARDLDPGYGRAFDAARAGGVEALAYVCAITPEAITVSHRVPILD